MQIGSKHFGESKLRWRAFTLVEILATIGIISLLAGIVIMGSRAVRSSQSRTFAGQQMTIIANAINAYTVDWPQWQYPGVNVAEKGWPDYLPGRLFNPARYVTISGFNDTLDFDVMDGITINTAQEDEVHMGMMLSANICLAYSLSAPVGKGPYITLASQLMLKDLQAFDGRVVNPALPVYQGSSSGAERAQILIDAWGVPYRYFWVYREPTAPKGFLPILTGDSTNSNFRKAVGFVLESAGPDKKFGNIWKLNPTPDEQNPASDNVTIMP